MLKKIALVISFVAIFFYQAPLVTPKVFAADDSTDIITAITNIWNGIINALFPKVATGKLDTTKKSLISSQNPQENLTDYTQQDKDWSHRTLTESLRRKFIGVWFNEVINNKTYSDEIVSNAEDDCPQINITDIIYYFATKTDQKILYIQGSSTPIDYPANINHPNSLGPDSCYENAYHGIQSIPQGIFQNQGDASLSSVQYNEQLRYTLPQSLQDSSNISNSTAQDTEMLVEDTEKHLRRSRAVYMPQSVKNQTNCSNNLTDEEKNYNLYKNFQKSITPQEWQGKTKNNTDDTTYQTYQIGTSVSDCSPGSGLSQYGAQGMAMKGYTYREILAAYYGIGTSGFDLGSVDSTNDKITVKLERKENMDNDNGISTCDELANEDPDRFKLSGNPDSTTIISDQLKQLANNSGVYRTLTLSVDDYLLGLGEIGLNWKLATHQALTVAARSYAYGSTGNLKDSITDTSEHDQVFQCSRLLINLHEDTVQKNAVNTTTGVVITKDGKIFTTQYLRCFGGPSSGDIVFDGSEFEETAGIVSNQTKGTCDDYVTLPKITGTAAATSALYIFPGSVHGGRIAEDYDLGTGNESQYLQTYSGDCRLDKRIFPALDRLVADAEAAIPGLKVGFYSCYRTYEEQAALSAKNPDTTTTALAGTSAHHTGRAIDFADPTRKITASSAFYKWLVANASKYGFYPYNVEAHHWEYNP